MKKWIILAVVAILLLILGIGGYFFVAAKNQTSTKTTTQTPEPTASENNTISGNIESLLSSGQNSQCTFSTDTSGTVSTGTVFVSQNKMRGDFSSSVSGKQTTSHMIRDGEWVYTWTDGTNQGVKMKITADLEKKAKEIASSNSATGTFDVNQNVDYSCKSWSTDTSKFQVPTNVTFVDLSAQMENINKMTDTVGDSKCKACDFIQDNAAKAECKKSLNC